MPQQPVDRPNREEELTERYKVVLGRVSGILFRMDPIGIADGNPRADEYEPEAQRILARADEAKSLDDPVVIIREVFAAQFGKNSFRSCTEVRAVARELRVPLRELIARP